MRMSDGALGRAGVATLIVAGVLAAVFSQVPSAALWDGWAPGDCREYCERFTACALPSAQRPAIQQPMNSWSNLAFVFVGFLAGFRYRTIGSWLFGVSVVVLGIGSFLFHASVTHTFQWLDVVGMYFAEVALLAFALHQVVGISYRWLLPGVGIADVFLAVFKWQLNTVFVMLSIGVAIAVLMSTQVRAGRRSLFQALLPGILIAIAYAVRGIDVQKTLCSPESLLQGHAIWHCLSAATLWYSFQFFTVTRSLQRDL